MTIEEYASQQKPSIFPTCLNDSNKNPCCHVHTKTLIQNNLDLFSYIMKFSQVSNEQLFEEDPIFFSKFVSNTSLVRKYNLTLIPGEKNHMGMLLFCDMVPDIMDAKKNRPGFSYTILIF
jgi:hypothetical protein